MVTDNYTECNRYKYSGKKTLGRESECTLGTKTLSIIIYVLVFSIIIFLQFFYILPLLYMYIFGSLTLR
jgi:hypothetical protein